MSTTRPRSFLERLLEKGSPDAKNRRLLSEVQERLAWQGARVFNSNMTPEQERAAREEKRRLEEELGTDRYGRDPLEVARDRLEEERRIEQEEKERRWAEEAEQARAEAEAAEEAARLRTAQRDRWVEDYAERIASHADTVAAKALTDLASQSNLPRDFDPSIPNLYVGAGYLHGSKVSIVIVDDASDRRRPVSIRVEDFDLPLDVVEHDQEEAFLQRAFDRAHSSLRSAFARAYSDYAAGRSLTSPADAPAPAGTPGSSGAGILSADLVADLDQVAHWMRGEAGADVVFARTILAFMPNTRAVMVDARHEGGGSTMFQVGRTDAPVLSEVLSAADPEVSTAAREYVLNAANNL